VKGTFEQCYGTLMNLQRLLGNVYKKTKIEIWPLFSREAMMPPRSLTLPTGAKKINLIYNIYFSNRRRLSPFRNISA